MDRPSIYQPSKYRQGKDKEKYQWTKKEQTDFVANNKADVVADEINAWVENVTSNLIKELLPPGSVDSDTRLVLGNALYFKGSWTEKFDASKTLNSEFYLLNGTSVEVAFMTSRKKQFLASYDGFKVLRLPYKQGEDKRSFSMYIFLPDAKDGLWSLEEKLNSESELLTRFLPMQKVEVNSNT
ncbi:serpin-ZXA [Zingiber officinale]|uniref:serpin-ZXA n=1 Tax=Zingiber officinale TaxID=94328 RepID=UPI001C4D7393|nr:serpin-ZXA [Zingiber officinale]